MTNTDANVRSIQALQDLMSAFTRFAHEADEVLSLVAIEIFRTKSWLEERAMYWQDQVRRQQELVQRLERSSAFQGPAASRSGEHPPGFRGGLDDPALNLARSNLQDAEMQLGSVRRWIVVVERDVADYEAQAERLRSLLMTDLPKAASFLHKCIGRLQSYLEISLSRINTEVEGYSLESTSDMHDPDDRLLLSDGSHHDPGHANHDDAIQDPH